MPTTPLGSLHVPALTCPLPFSGLSRDLYSHTYCVSQCLCKSPSRTCPLPPPVFCRLLHSCTPCTSLFSTGSNLTYPQFPDVLCRDLHSRALCYHVLQRNLNSQAHCYPVLPKEPEVKGLVLSSPLQESRLTCRIWTWK